ncbi:MAG TPA: hypothetical protein VGX03_00595 [Candidatus Binatia bacterium]|jgi:hypothetical protein|nr:hypothetical protein [Candidatus Binatia bacterium]
MSRLIEEKIDKLQFTGAVDADGHIPQRQVPAPPVTGAGVAVVTELLTVAGACPIER